MADKLVLAAVDFSPVSAEVIATASTLAEAVGAHLLLWHAVQLPSAIVSYEMAGENVAEFIAGAERDAEGRLGALARCVNTVPVECGCSSGVPAAEICLQARDRGAGFVVVGSHGHGALYEFLIGTTTQGILKDAPCPVVIVPAARPKAARKYAVATEAQ